MRGERFDISAHLAAGLVHAVNCAKGGMQVDISYATDPAWWGLEKTHPAEHTFRDDFSQIDRHRETASRLIELAAWNMREAERLALAAEKGVELL